MSAPAALVVDDLDEVRGVVAGELRDLGFEVLEADDGESAWTLFGRHRPALVVTDLVMPNCDGLELLRRIRRTSTVPVLMLTSHADIRTAVKATRLGASEFLSMPDGVGALSSAVTGLLDDGATTARRAVGFEVTVVGRSAAMRRVRSRMRGVSPLVDLPVHVWGEPGTGRRHVVEAIHAASPIGARPLVGVGDDGALRGADLQSGGALYLPDLAGLSADDQRFIAGAWAAAGATRSERRPRLFASTVEPLVAETRAGRVLPALARIFRRATIGLPPLRDRGPDLRDLTQALCTRIGRHFGRADVRVTDAGIARLRGHDWPGNVRELHEMLEKLIVFNGPSNIDVRAVEEALQDRACLVRTAREQRKREQEAELTALLAETGGNLAEAARRLGLSRSTVHYRARKFGLLGPP